MRTSKDEYRLTDGSFLSLSQGEHPPKGATVWNGYDYEKQKWIFKGKEDIRSIEELRKAITDKTKESKKGKAAEKKHEMARKMK